MKKLLSLLTLFITLIITSTSAGARTKSVREVPEENFAYIEEDEGYWSKFVPYHAEYIHDIIEGKKLGDYSLAGYVEYNREMIADKVEWVNPDQIIAEGEQIVQIKAVHNGEEIILTGDIIGIKPDEPTAPSLTATTVTLESRTVYDINLNDKVSGCKYKWTSSNPDIAKVNVKNGLVTAVSEGTATITCVITYPDETKQTLISEVTVGYDDNAPELTDTVLDLNPGDEYDINVENKIAKSKYRWASSDRSIVTVNSANGIVTAKATGTAYVTCTITTPDKQVIVLRCDINVTEPKEIK